MEANEMTFAETVVSVLTSKFGGKKDDAAKWDACVVVPN